MTAQMSADPNPTPSPSLSDWVAGARPRTLPAAVVPVAVGAGCAAGAGASFGDEVVWWRVAAALVVSLLLQVGVNYANDYSDGVKGTDDVRVGPMRLVATGTASAGSVKRAALATLLAAAVVGLVLAAATTWWLIAVGAVAILAAWGYTGGPKPYGYLGLGELFVFVFFGLVATVGTTYVAIEAVPGITWVAASGVGFLACALLVINNLRDIPTDRAVGKRTLAVRIGDRTHAGVVRLVDRRRIPRGRRVRRSAQLVAAGPGGTDDRQRPDPKGARGSVRQGPDPDPRRNRQDPTGIRRAVEHRARPRLIPTSASRPADSAGAKVTEQVVVAPAEWSGDQGVGDRWSVDASQVAITSAVSSGRSVWAACPAPAIGTNVAVGSASVIRRPISANLVSSSPAITRIGIGILSRCCHIGGLVAGAAPPQAVGQAGRGVPAAMLEVVLAGRQVGEHRRRQPLVEERLDPDRFDPVGTLTIETAPFVPFGVIVDPWCRTDQYQPFDDAPAGQCGDQREPATHRVADVGALPGELDQRRTGRSDLRRCLDR